MIFWVKLVVGTRNDGRKQLTCVTPLALSRSVVVASVCSRQGFLTSGSSALLHGLPNLDEISDLVLEATQSPVHSGGNRLGISPNFPCHPHWAPATVQLDVT